MLRKTLQRGGRTGQPAASGCKGICSAQCAGEDHTGAVADYPTLSAMGELLEAWWGIGNPAVKCALTPLGDRS